MKDKGLTSNQVKDKLSGLVQATDGAGDVGDVAEASDEIGYKSTGTILVWVGDDRVLSLYGDSTQNHNIGTKFLQDTVPGFVPGQLQAIVITVQKGNQFLVSYHVYKGGKTFGPALPQEQVSGREVVPVSFKLLAKDSFADSVPAFQMVNSGQVAWMADQAIAQHFALTGNTLTVSFLEDSPYVDIGEFTLSGTVDNYPGYSSEAGAISLQFGVTDYIGRTSEMRIQYSGYGAPTFQILKGGAFQKVNLVCYDGSRLSVLYGTDNSVATLYLRPPSSEIYVLSDMNQYSGEYLALVDGKYSAAFQIENVALLRNLEKNMQERGSEYDLGRLGTEVAYVVGTDKLGLQNLVIQEPSAGGRDLYTQDNAVAIQTRFLVHLNPDTRLSTIQEALFSLVDKLQKDYGNQRQMMKGYAILSYVDVDGLVKTIVLEVPKR